MVESNAAELFLIPCSIQHIHTKIIGNNQLVNHIMVQILQGLIDSSS